MQLEPSSLQAVQFSIEQEIGEHVVLLTKLQPSLQLRHFIGSFFLHEAQSFILQIWTQLVLCSSNLYPGRHSQQLPGKWVPQFATLKDSQTPVMQLKLFPYVHSEQYQSVELHKRQLVILQGFEHSEVFVSEKYFEHFTHTPDSLHQSQLPTEQAFFWHYLLPETVTSLQPGTQESH